jgi:hypothetical protein
LKCNDEFRAFLRNIKKIPDFDLQQMHEAILETLYWDFFTGFSLEWLNEFGFAQFAPMSNQKEDLAFFCFLTLTLGSRILLVKCHSRNY